MPQLSAAKADAVRRLVFSIQRSQASKKRPGRSAGDSRQPAPEPEAEPAGEEVCHFVPARLDLTMIASTWAETTHPTPSLILTLIRTQLQLKL